MTRRREFTTAAARRKADPIIWVIDDVEVRLRPAVDITELGAMVESVSEPVENESGATALSRRRSSLLQAIELCVQPEDVKKWRGLTDSLDLAMLAEMVQEVVAEYSGAANPTKPSSSSDGSSATGDSSTAGAQAED